MVEGVEPDCGREAFLLPDTERSEIRPNMSDSLSHHLLLPAELTLWPSVPLDLRRVGAAHRGGFRDPMPGAALARRLRPLARGL